MECHPKAFNRFLNSVQRRKVWVLEHREVAAYTDNDDMSQMDYGETEIIQIFRSRKRALEFCRFSKINIEWNDAYRDLRDTLYEDWRYRLDSRDLL